MLIIVYVGRSNVGVLRRIVSQRLSCAFNFVVSSVQLWVTLLCCLCAITSHPLKIWCISFQSRRLSCAGVWATLQFKWIQMQYPAVTLTFEKMLMTAAPPVATAVQSWGVVASAGASAAAFYLAALLAIMYYAFGMPLKSSFFKEKTGRAIGARCAGYKPQILSPESRVALSACRSSPLCENPNCGAVLSVQQGLMLVDSYFNPCAILPFIAEAHSWQC